MLLRIFMLLAVLTLLQTSSAQKTVIQGTHPQYDSSYGVEVASILLNTGVYGAFVTYFRFEPRDILSIDVIYQHYGQPCDQRRCGGLSYKVIRAKSGLGFSPGYELRSGGVAFRFESGLLEHSKEGRRRHGVRYLDTAYIVIVRLKNDKYIRFFEAP